MDGAKKKGKNKNRGGDKSKKSKKGDKKKKNVEQQPGEASKNKKKEKAKQERGESSQITESDLSEQKKLDELNNVEKEDKLQSKAGEKSKKKKKKKAKQELGESSQITKSEESEKTNLDEINDDEKEDKNQQRKVVAGESSNGTQEPITETKDGKSSIMKQGEGDFKTQNTGGQDGEQNKCEDDEQGSGKNEKNREHHNDQNIDGNANIGSKQSKGANAEQGQVRVDLGKLIHQLNVLLTYVPHENIHNLLQRLQSMQLWQIQNDQRFKIFKWILETIMDPRAKICHFTYFALVLAQLKFIPEHFFGRNYRAAFDRILFGLDGCYKMQLFSPVDMHYLKSVAPKLVKNCSEPGWLTLASYFYPCFGARALVDDTTYELRCYKIKVFHELADRLLNHIPSVLNEKELAIHKELFQRMFQFINVKCIVKQVLDDQRINVIFTLEEKQHILQNFGKVVKQQEFKRKVKNLSDFLNSKWSKQGDKSNDALKLLTEFVESSDDDIPQRDQEIFTEVALKQDFLTSDLLHILLVRMANKMSAHKLLLELLHHESVGKKWNEFSQGNKLDLLSSFLRTKVADPKAPGNKTTKTYTVGESISSVTLFLEDKQLLPALFQFISDKFLKSEDSGSVLKAYSDIENLSTLTQEHFKLHVKQLLKSKYEKLIIKPLEIMREWSKSSFGQSLLLVVLEVLQISKKEDKIEESFRNMIKHCDIWIILLKANEYLEADPKFKEGKSLWVDLKRELDASNISVYFLDQISTEKTKLTEIFRCLFTGSTDEDWFVKQLTQLEQSKELFSKKKEKLRKVINYVKKAFGNYSTYIDMSRIFVEYNEREQIDWQKMKINQLSDDFWGPLCRLNNLAASIEPLIESLSFKQFLDSENAEEFVIFRFESRDVYSEVDRIISNSLSQFYRCWNPVFNNITTLTWKTLEKLIKEVKDDKKLNEEFTILEKNFRKKLSNDAKEQMRDFVLFPSVLIRIDFVLKILQMFEVDNSDEMNMLKSFSNFEDDEPDNLFEFHEMMIRVQNVLSSFITEEDDVDALKELSESTDLYKFVKETMDEDIRFLVDAVEEHSDIFVSESIVSDLIEIHRLICPLIKTKSFYVEVRDFLEALKQKSETCKNLALIIQQCNINIHSLEHLYKSVANRGEISREKIPRCPEKGMYTISLDKGMCDINISYGHRGNTQCYSLSDLHNSNMAERCVLASSNKCSNKMLQNLELESVIRNEVTCNLIYDGKNLKWILDFDSLQHFVEDVVGIGGKWSSPGGSAKKFIGANSNLSLTWYSGKQKTLSFQGKDGNYLKQVLINVCCKLTGLQMDSGNNKGDVPDACKPSQLPDDSEDMSLEAVLKPSCGCSCGNMYTEIENMKLNIKRIQSKLESLQCMNTQMSPAATDNGYPSKILNLEYQLHEEKEKNKQLKSKLEMVIKKYNVTEVNNISPIDSSVMCKTKTPPTSDLTFTNESLVDSCSIVPSDEINEANIFSNSYNAQLESYKIKQMAKFTQSSDFNAVRRQYPSQVNVLDQCNINSESLNGQLKWYRINQKSNFAKTRASKSGIMNNHQRKEDVKANKEDKNSELSELID